MSHVALYPVPLVVPGRLRLFGEGNYADHRGTDQGPASGHRGTYDLFWLSLINMLINTSREKVGTFILLSILVFSPTLVKATTYYVAPSGSNSNPGTQAAPFATLQKAADVANAGDAIYMRGGTYNVSVQQTLSRSGSSGNWIKVFSYPGEIPILNASGQGSTDNWVIRTNGSWWHIKGLEIKNNPRGGGILLSSSNNIVENNNIHHNGANSAWAASGISIFQGQSDNLLLNNDLHHNKDADNGDADGIEIKHNVSSGNILRGNRVWRNSDDGIDLWNSANVTLENNWAFENGLDDDLRPLGNGQGFKLGGTGANDGNHTLKNNVSWKNRSSGFHYNAADRPITMYNNVAWSNPGNNYVFGGGVNNTFRNNISFGSLGSISGSDTFNSWTLGVTVSTAHFASCDDACARGPRQADGSLPNCNFMKLATGSTLIDKGTNVGIAYNGSAPDLGAFEYGGTSPPPPPPPPPPPSSPPPPPPPSSSCTQTPLTVSTAFSDGGFAYMVIKTFGIPADNSNRPVQSTLRFFENGVEMGPTHARHVDIRNLGTGRFSHWSQTDGTGEALRLSASNNSDPRTNGKSYTYCVPVPLMRATGDADVVG